MADIVRAVGRLRLAAQHHLVDQRRLLGAGDLLQHAVEVARMHLVARRQRDAERRAGSRAGASSFSSDGGACTRYMQGWRSRSSSSAARDVGQHHELLDQPVAVEARARRDGGDPALLVQHHLALGQIEIERAARRARREQRAEGGVERSSRPAGRRRPSPRVVARPAPARRSAARRCASGRGRSGGASLRPSASMRISTNRQPRSSSGRRLHQPLDSASGSIGTTRSGK